LPLPPDEERFRDDAEAERREEALERLPLPLVDFVRERGLLFAALLLFDALPLLDAFDVLFREVRAEPLALDPFELWEFRFCLLDELFACAITPPWVFIAWARKLHTPVGMPETL
jgi:hypothetical protein